MTRCSTKGRMLAFGAALTLAGCYGPEEPVRPIPSYVVTFDGQATELDGVAAQVVDAAAGAAKVAPDRPILVEGYAASRAGTPQSNQIQTRLRAQAVANALVARGVAKDRVTIRPKTSFGADPGSESRRVDIVIGP